MDPNHTCVFLGVFKDILNNAGSISACDNLSFEVHTKSRNILESIILFML